MDAPFVHIRANVFFRHETRERPSNPPIVAYAGHAVGTQPQGTSDWQRLPQDPHTNYKVDRELGRGKFGTVCLATCLRTGRNFAIKSISKHQPDFETAIVRREIEILNIVSAHPNIAGIHEVLTVSTAISTVDAASREPASKCNMSWQAPCVPPDVPTNGRENDSSVGLMLTPLQCQTLCMQLNLIAADVQVYEDGSFVYVVMEPAMGGELFDLIVDR